MMVVVHSHHYDHILVYEGIYMIDTPSWGIIDFLDNPSKVECAQHLAM